MFNINAIIIPNNTWWSNQWGCYKLYFKSNIFLFYKKEIWIRSLIIHDFKWIIYNYISTNVSRI